MAYDFSAIKVLVVDDNAHMHQILRSILGAMRIKDVHCAIDLESGMDELSHRGADIVITDLMIGESDGLDLVRAIRAGEKGVNPYLPVVLLTGYTERSSITKARDAGVHEILAKPVSVENLYRRFVSVVVNPRPFVKSGHFFGPCRRRQMKGPEGDERRSKAEAAADAAAGAARGKIPPPRIPPPKVLAPKVLAPKPPNQKSDAAA